jgi:magnesium-transporting ATPase (P-type)
MNAVSNNRLPQVTRWLVYIIMALIAFVGVVLALVGVVLPFYWDEAAVEIVKEYPKLDTSALLPRLLAVFAFAIVMMGIVWTMMKRLLAMINSVEAGDPFIIENAKRLKAIGWMMVALQVLAFPLALVARNTADLFGEHDVNLDFSVNGLLAILLVFILADVFKRGAEMREELEGTV